MSRIADQVTSSSIRGFAGHVLAVIHDNPFIKRSDLVSLLHEDNDDRTFPRHQIKRHVYNVTTAMLRHGWIFRQHDGGFRVSEKGAADVEEHRLEKAELRRLEREREKRAQQ